MKKKIVSVMLSTVIAASTLTACGGQGAATGAASADSATEATAECGMKVMK